MSAHTDLCRGQPCYVRLQGCDGGGETTVPAHWRGIGISGAGMKAPCLLTCPACFNCHDLIDRRKVVPEYSRDDVQLAHAKGIFHWQCKLISDGKIHTGHLSNPRKAPVRKSLAAERKGARK